MKNKAFTIVEVLVTLGIFLILMGMVASLVINSFFSFRAGEKMLSRNQGERACLSRLSREVSSLVRRLEPNVSFVGRENGFFLSSPRRRAW